MAPPACWPVVALAGFTVGIALYPLSDVRLLALALSLLVGAGLLLTRYRRLLLLLFALAVASGYLRMGGESRILAVDPLRGQDRRELEIRGTVLESPRPRAWGCAFRFHVERVETMPDLPPLEILVESGPEAIPAPGERWVFRGHLASLPGPRHPRGFDAGAWLARQGIHHRLKVDQARHLPSGGGWGPVAVAWRLRAWLVGNLEACLQPEEARALVLGILLGEARVLPPDLQEAFRRSGTSHLLAASGLNVAVVTGLVFWLARRLGFAVQPAALPAAAGAGLYTLLAGSSPSVVRAAVMAWVGLLALVSGRRSSPANSLFLGALALLAFRPGWLQDVGFQLSMGAVMGMVAWCAPLERRLVKLPRCLQVGFSATLAASLATAPLLAWHFQEISAVSLLANLIMTPVAEALLPLGMATAVLAGFCEPLARLPGGACCLASEFLSAAARGFGAAVQPLPVPRPDLPSLGGVLLAFVWLRLELAREGTWVFRTIVALLALGVLSWGLAPEPAGSGRLRIRLAELPRGALAWVTTPGGRDLVLVSAPEDRPHAREVLGLYGRRLPEGLFHPPQAGSWTVSPEPGLRVECRPGWLRLTWSDFALVWALRQADLASTPPGHVALLPRAWQPQAALERVQPRLLFWSGGPPRKPWRELAPAWWSSDEHGPLEVETDGERLYWRRWRE
ncbi:MAG: ComEC family competence protein [Burkholderiales bacterium]|nr:ComEC family competence protein [Burkholderiales bacterium]